MKGLEAYGELLQRAGVKVVFTMVGGTNVSWLGHAHDQGILKVVKTRHEESAVQAAIGYARVSGGVGVCSVTRGPGFANAIAGLLAAAKTNVPLVLFVGQSPSPNPVTTQNVPQEELTKMLGAGFWHAEDVSELGGVVFGAIRAALDTGVPQVLSSNEACQWQDVDLGEQRLAPRGQRSVDGGCIRAAIGSLGESERPLIIAGQGALLADCREDLFRLADLVGADVATTLSANRYFSGHPRELGVCGGWGTPLAHRRLTERDVILGVGASLNQFTMDLGGISNRATLIQCVIGAGEANPVRPPDIIIEADAGDAVRALVDAWEAAGHSARHQPAVPSIVEQRASVLEARIGHDPARGLDVRRVIAALDSALPSDRIVVTDSGRTAALLTALVEAEDARSFVLGRAYGVVGLGLGMAIGAAVARPDRRVALFTGDGGFMMGLAALDTVRLYQLDNVAVFILNDGQYGGEAPHLEKFGLSKQLIRQSIPDVHDLAKVYGGTGMVVRTEQELTALVVPERGFFVVDARTDPEIHPHDALANPPGGHATSHASEAH